MRSPRPLSAAAASLAACAALAGCGVSGDGEEGAAREPDQVRTPVNAGAVEPGESEPRPTLASQDVTDGGTDLHIAVHELARRGETVELTFSVTNLDDDGTWYFAEQFSGGGVVHEDADSVAAVELVDPVNGRLHLVARDSAGDCVCSSPKWGSSLAPGDSVLLSATFGAPPEDVTSMTVRMPLAGSFNDVPIS